jgi:hypothetical protein
LSPLAGVGVGVAFGIAGLIGATVIGTLLSVFVDATVLANATSVVVDPGVWLNAPPVSVATTAISNISLIGKYIFTQTLAKFDNRSIIFFLLLTYCIPEQMPSSQNKVWIGRSNYRSKVPDLVGFVYQPSSSPRASRKLFAFANPLGLVSVKHNS